jgi:hypothetical protein
MHASVAAAIPYFSELASLLFLAFAPENYQSIQCFVRESGS